MRLAEYKILIELKSVEKMAFIHHARLLTDLKLSQNPLSLLINFNAPLLKDGIRRLSAICLNNYSKNLSVDPQSLRLCLELRTSKCPPKNSPQ